MCLLVFTEFNTSASSQASTVLFKQGSKTPVLKEVASVGDDEEKAQPATGSSSTVGSQASSGKNQVIDVQPKVTNTFSWRHLSYTVSVPGDHHRLLLDNISGFVAPGKLTALMGESGAGKV